LGFLEVIRREGGRERDGEIEGTEGTEDSKRREINKLGNQFVLEM
jgi:hypothetical protein